MLSKLNLFVLLLHFYFVLLIIKFLIFIHFELQFMKPIYQQFVEKSVSVAVAQATEAASNVTMSAVNGKPKQS